jgi:ribosomal protein S21
MKRAGFFRNLKQREYYRKPSERWTLKSRGAAGVRRRSGAMRRLLRQMDALAARHLTYADWPDQIEAVRLQQQLERADVLGRQLRLLEVARCEAVDAKDGSRDGQQRHPAHYQVNDTRPNQKVPEPAAWTPSRTPAPCGRLPAVGLLTQLDAFFTEHGRCGDLDAGVQAEVVWITCDCGASMARQIGRGRPTPALIR